MNETLLYSGDGEKRLKVFSCDVCMAGIVLATCPKCHEIMLLHEGRTYCPNCGVTEPFEVNKAPTSKTAVGDIQMERSRQDRKWGEQNHHPMVWLSILGEEFGELCQAVNETVFDNGPQATLKGGRGNMRKEAVQVAAVAQALVEYLDRTESIETCNNGGVKDNRHVRLK